MRGEGGVGRSSVPAMNLRQPDCTEAVACVGFTLFPQWDAGTSHYSVRACDLSICAQIQDWFSWFFPFFRDGKTKSKI